VSASAFGGASGLLSRFEADLGALGLELPETLPWWQTERRTSAGPCGLQRTVFRSSRLVAPFIVWNTRCLGVTLIRLATSVDLVEHAALLNRQRISLPGDDGWNDTDQSGDGPLGLSRSGKFLLTD
jgi:hypothetical protein